MVTVRNVRLLWVMLLLVPACVVFVVARLAIGPIAGAERLEVLPHVAPAVSLPASAIGIATPRQRVTVPRHASRSATNVPSKTVVGHIVGSTSAGRAFKNPNAPAG